MLFTGVFIVSISIFAMSIIRQTVISFLVAVELFLLAVNLVFVAFSFLFHVLEPQIVALYNLTFSASESGLGLSIFVQFYRAKGRVDYYTDNSLKN